MMISIFDDKIADDDKRGILVDDTDINEKKDPPTSAGLIINFLHQYSPKLSFPIYIWNIFPVFDKFITLFQQTV
jgi:hypothetical protein